MLGALLVSVPVPCHARRVASVSLAWTATGDDDRAGLAARYELRYSTAPVGSDVLAWWNAARIARNLPAPGDPGRPERARVNGLEPETEYWFILCAYDRAGNRSDFSNVASARTSAGEDAPPGFSLHAYPNPSRDVVRFVIHVTGPEALPVRLRVFDMAGHVVGDVANGLAPPGDTEVVWDGRTIWGKRVAPGYYESIASIGSWTARERIVLLP